MPDNPIYVAVVDGEDVPKDDFRAAFLRLGMFFSTLTEFRNTDTRGQKAAMVGGLVWGYDTADTTTADDGVNCIIDLSGVRRYKRLPMDGSAEVAVHVAQPDPHPQYLTASEGNAAYSPLSHASLTNNPHSVTKAQVGLANADNTSDANKPVSNAVAAVLGAQQTINFGTLVSTGTDLAAYTIGRQQAALANGRVRSVRFATGGAATGIVYVVTLTGTTVTAITALKSFSVAAAGIHTINPDLPILAGQYAFVYLSTARFQNGIGGQPAAWIKSGTLAAGNNVINNTTHKHEIEWALDSGIIAQANSAEEDVDDIEAALGQRQDIGWSSPAASGSSASGITYVINDPPVFNGVLRELTLGAPASGSVVVQVVSMSGLNATAVSEQIVQISAGLHSYLLNLPIAAGQFVTLYATSSIHFVASNPTGQRVWFKSGKLTVGVAAAVADNASNRFEMSFVVSSGLRDDVLRQDLAVDLDGQSLMNDADPAGIVDATAILAAAAAHPQVYIPPGTFAVTAMPRNGDGIYGDGTLLLNGKRVFLAAARSFSSLYQKVRNFFAFEIGNSAPVLVIADSIGEWAGATDRTKHWSTFFAQFGNILHSPTDEVIVSALVSHDTYAIAWNGFSTTGTVTAGANGPVGNLSAVLASGATMTFTGNYRTLGVWLCKAAGAGTLTVTADGTNISTINANAATDNNFYSGLIATGKTASATYVLTATGGPVEVTGIARWGALSPSNRKRLNVLNCSRGAWSTSDLTTARIDAMLKMSVGLSATKPSVLLFLGINDRVLASNSLATIKANLEASIDYLIAQGVTKILGGLPLRMADSKDDDYDYLYTHDELIGTIAGVYRQKGVRILNVNAADYAGRGLLGADLLHPNDGGHAMFVNLLLESIAANAD